MSNLKKTIVATLMLGLLIMAGFAYFVYTNIFVPNTSFENKKAHVYISTGANFNDVLGELSPLIKKYKDEKFLLPNTDKVKPAVPEILNTLGVDWKQATFFKTVVSDLSDLANVSYDVLVFFSPSGIESLFQNFPDFQQNETRIAVFGNTTIKAVEEKGLRVDISAPTPETPSMTMALQKYIEKANKGK